MNYLVVVLFFGFFLSAPLWMTWGAGKVFAIRARSGPGGGAELVAVGVALASGV
ncbi:hypothetical protein [Streptomyces sp. NPDC093018]|uniref:hypothetical protein n=1 Tax=Streptomyces sp. NPDC093018 TaxID=3155067 RepID=UPI0034322F5B